MTDIAVLAEWRVSIPQDRINAYAQASGDLNPIHLDPAAAAALGFKSPIAHGMLVTTLIESHLLDVLGDRMKRFGIQFVRPVFAGDDVRVEFKLSKRNDDTTKIRIFARNAQGELVAAGDAHLEPT